VLEDCGFSLNVYSIFEISWIVSHRIFFFDGDPVHTWFDYSAPSIDRSVVSSRDALAYMVADPLLIKCPLIHFNGEYCASFEMDLVKRMITLAKKLSPGVVKMVVCV